ncbi:glycosyltransferase family 9 protein [Rhizosphaericola mali]|uniref:Glycosyltransferase family 9 protein n=1 Tax=Rhizosphaericola mali TaxID=2545455 RepID=A0A5P2G4S4_9BACT|nr:glycosyltransferase family 9 protein [Rhizosphaericola mali]QES90525.1 glycosyltransferase family 9 protein [Rhizosphaericola mali]
MLKRLISVYLRKFKRKKSVKKHIAFVALNKEAIQHLPNHPSKNKIIILVRMDEIGDYILSRNTFSIIKNAPKFKDYKIIFIGNKLNKNIAETLDTDTVDEFLWIDKEQFKKDHNYRSQIFTNINNINAEIAVELERTSDVNLGGIIIEATNAIKKYGSSNYYLYDKLNILSDSFFNHLFPQNFELTHEFLFNQRFVNWVSDTNISITKPAINAKLLPKLNLPEKYILCMIGSSKKSKNWPLRYWIELIGQLLVCYKEEEIVLLGGNREEEFAQGILDEIKDERLYSMVSKTNLMESFSWINAASLMISNDTFAVHARVALNEKPTVVMANGESSFRFSDLGQFSPNYTVIYSKQYLEYLPKMKNADRWIYNVSSVDMATIFPKEVLDKCLELYKN